MKSIFYLIGAFAMFLGIWAGCTSGPPAPTAGPAPVVDLPPPSQATRTTAPTLEKPPTTSPATKAAAPAPEKPRARTVAELAALAPGPERSQILEQGARQEGEVMLYTSATGLEPLVEDFARKYPFVKADVWTTRVPALVERVTAETKAGRMGGDVLHGSMTSYTPLKDQLLKFNSPGAEFTVTPKGATSYIGLVVFSYSTKRVKPEDVPTKAEDFLNPRWKGKLGIFAPPNTFPGLWVNMLRETMGEAKARDFLTKLSGQDLFFYDSPQIAEKALTDGQIDINMQGSTNARRRVGEGLPLNWTAPEPTMGYAMFYGLFKDAPHPHASLMLIDYLLSPEVQNKIPKVLGALTTREIASGEVDGVKLPKTLWLQTEERVDQIPEGTRIFEQLVMKK